MMHKRVSVAIALSLFLLFLGVEFYGLFSLEAASPYAIYLFETGFVALTWGVFKKMEWKKRGLSLRESLLLLLLLIAGYGVHAFTRLQGIEVPFDFKNPEMILFLLCLGPILEESVYRGALWRIITASLPMRSTVNAGVALLVTTLLFGYAHYFVIHQVPENFAPFIRYQGVYTLGLGLVCGWARYRYGVALAMVFHAVFNLGFWLYSTF